MALKGRYDAVKEEWLCDCNSPQIAEFWQVGKPGANKGRWFHRCPDSQDKSKDCHFFLWKEDAEPREKAAKAALANNSRTEPDRANPNVSPTTPVRRQASASKPSRKRSRTISDNDDEYGSGETEDDEPTQVKTEPETPRYKAIKTTNFATPATGRRILSQQLEVPNGRSTHGLQTPQSDHKFSGDPFTSRQSQVVTPSSSFETPTPSRLSNVTADDLIRDVFGLLQEAHVQLGADDESELESMLSKYAKSAEGDKKRLVVSQKMVKAKDAEITGLKYRISTLEAQLEAEKAQVELAEWESQQSC